MKMKELALAMCLSAFTFAQVQDSPKKAAFEVASIRAANQDGNVDIDAVKGHFAAHNVTLKRLAALAYEIDPRQISGGPGWVDSDSYDINAKVPEEFVSQTHQLLPQMIQSLLADRFQLAIHREPREASGYALVVDKKGPKMERAKTDAKNPGFHSGNTHLTAENVTMEGLANHLSRNRDIGKIIVDKTGLTGRFDFELNWTPERLALKPEASFLGEPKTSDDRPSIFTALQEQLGLKLESVKVPFSAVVIDRAEKPEEN